MSILVKRSDVFPFHRSMVEDFWKADSFFGIAPIGSDRIPSVNVAGKKNHYKIMVAAPGYKKDDFKITAENGTLTISAETKSDEKEENENYLRQEFFFSSFTRTFSLPDDVEEDKIDAKYKDGVLNINLQKSSKAAAQKKKIKVN